MALVSYVRARAGAGVTYVPTPAGLHPTARLRTDDEALELPYAPRGATLGGWANTYETVNRPGRAPLVIRTGNGLPTLSLSVFLGYASDHQQSIEPLLAQLRKIAEAGDRVTLVNLSVQERGPWRLADVNPVVELRQHGTNHATRATVELSFIAATSANVKLGPVAGGKGGKGPGKPRKGESRYTIKGDESLAKIAGKELGDASEWPRIAKRNDLKRVDDGKAGDVIIIPADKD